MECAAGNGDRDRVVFRVREASSEFALPLSIGSDGIVEEVKYVSSDIPEGLLCFEVPVTRSWLKMYSLDGEPETEREVQWMLRAGHATFHRPVWKVFNGTLYLWPPAPCDGRLIVDYVK